MRISSRNDLRLRADEQVSKLSFPVESGAFTSNPKKEWKAWLV